MARTIQPEYGPDYGKLILQGLGAYGQVKGIQTAQAKEERGIAEGQRRIEIEDEDRFKQETIKFAAEIADLPEPEQILRVQSRIADLDKRNINSETTKRLLGNLQSPDPAVKKSAQDAIKQRRELGYQTNVLKRPPAPKAAKTAYRIATDQEKLAAGITDLSPYQISPKGQFVKLGGKGQTINISTGAAGDKLGKIPPGYAARKTDEGYEMYEVKGGPPAKKTIETEKKTEAQRQTTARTANIVKEDIGRLRSIIEDQAFYNPVTGPTGGIASEVPGSARKDAEALKNTIGANVGFDRLQAMREASKTGGALGAISEREMKQLEAVMGSIELDQSPEQLTRNLDRLERIYDEIIKKASAYPNAEEFGFGGVTIPQQQVQTPAQEATPEQLERYK
jgi:hypothetical protein